jgi:NADH-quinone oxidoreductase subunit G
VRWPERAQAAAFPDAGDAPRGTAEARPAAAPEPGAEREPAAAPEPGAAPRNVGLRLGTYRPIWAAPEVEVSPALQYTIAQQQLELSPEDAQRLNIAGGETVDVSQNGTTLAATARVRSGVPSGTAFLADGLAADSANAFTELEIEVRKR